MVCIQQKTFTKITATDIINEAKINRSTFYKYYKDKYDLRELLVKSTLEELSNNIKLNFFKLQYNKINTYRSSFVQYNG
ncbi:TetR/AcrR family transcriptional regulator [Paenibacillus terrae]|uniref:TetR/AcrR family transcriptional regulator n=1 Tax=Paenibacillus TaxID=44249 RepID=UPI0011EB7A32|nr:TetR/AcrR family transcriptional regulator [Paenibacillus sp. 23TSA30-6]